MATVTIRFKSPESPDTAALHIYEGGSANGPFVDIQRTTAIGAYPDYISSFTTAAATSAHNWFAIAWEDVDGVVGDMSEALKGGTESYVAQIVARVLQRDGTLEGDVVRQEAEGAIEKFFLKDPYSVDPLVDLSEPTKYNVTNGLTYLVMARSMLDRLLRTSSFTSATIGLVTLKQGESATTTKNIEALLAIANDLLGVSYSFVMLLEEATIGNSISNPTYLDQSRLMLEVEVA